MIQAEECPLLGAGQVVEAGSGQGGWHRSWVAPDGPLASGVVSGESRCQNITVDRNIDIYTHTQMCTHIDVHTGVHRQIHANIDVHRDTHKCVYT